MAAVATANLGSVLLQVGRYAEARELLEEGVKLLRDSGNLRELALAHNALGNIGVDTGRYADAETHFDVALRCARDVGVRQYEAMRARAFFKRCIESMPEGLSCKREADFT